MLSQIMQAWKDPYRTRLGQLVGGCTAEYIVWRRQKIEDMVLPPARMRALVPDPIPKQISEVDIVRSEFASERLKMEQKYKKLQELAEKLDIAKARKVRDGTKIQET